MEFNSKGYTYWNYLFFYGATGENRTPDLQVTNLLLYRLSHGSKSSPILQRGSPPVKKA